MMLINLVPKVNFSAFEALSLNVMGDVLNINGADLDLSIIPDGAEIEEGLARSLHPAISGPIYREGGELHVTLTLPLSPDCTDPWMCFPDPITVSEDGPVDLPFATWSETTEVKIADGTNIVTTTHRWHKDETVVTMFVPDPVEPEEEEA